MNDDLSDCDMHFAGACGGVGDLCEYCDEAMAQRIKRLTPPRKTDYDSVAIQ